jgi:DNA-binding transcriptional LysR family regulator
VARTRSFRQAALELGYVQSAVSQHISSLEAFVGTRLVERRRGQRAVTLTPAGRLLLERGTRILGQLRAARVDIAAIEAGSAVIRLTVASDSTGVLAPLLASVTEQLPSARVHVTESPDDGEVAASIGRGAADVGIGSPAPDPGLSTATLVHDPFVVLVPRGSPLVELRSVSNLEQLAGERLIISASALSKAHLRAAGLPLGQAIQVPGAAVVLPLVAAGVGVGLVPESDAANTGDELVALSTAGLIAPRRVVLCWHAARCRTAVLESFTEVALRAFRDGGTMSRAADIVPVA